MYEQTAKPRFNAMFEFNEDQAVRYRDVAVVSFSEMATQFAKYQVNIILASGIKLNRGFTEDHKGQALQTYRMIVNGINARENTSAEESDDVTE